MKLTYGMTAEIRRDKGDGYIPGWWVRSNFSKVETVGRAPHQFEVFKSSVSSNGDVVYGLFSSSSSVPQSLVGYIQFDGLVGEDDEVVTPSVSLSYLHPRFRGQGLGRTLYKTSANDLLKKYTCVRSDSTRSRAAEGVWKSLCRANPKIVQAKYSDDYGNRFGVFEVYKPLRRRPVKVRRHRRARHG
jgi:GNAT superfamily N-acetyltransferase